MHDTVLSDIQNLSVRSLSFSRKMELFLQFSLGNEAHLASNRLSNNTKVCLRHFKSDDLKKSLNGVVSLKNGVVPSVFAWKRSSPCKQPPPTPRISSIAASVSQNLNENISELVESACLSESLETSECSSHSHLAPEMEAQQTATKFDLQSKENLEIARLEKLLADTIEIKETLESEVLSLKANIALVEQK